jgi:hypothetical protein
VAVDPEHRVIVAVQAEQGAVTPSSDHVRIRTIARGVPAARQHEIALADARIAALSRRLL